MSENGKLCYSFKQLLNKIGIFKMLVPNVELICERLNELENIFNDIFKIVKAENLTREEKKRQIQRWKAHTTQSWTKR